MKAYVFPGQGAQFVGMGKDLYESNAEAATLFDQANEILGFDIKSIMFEGTDEQLKETAVTQPAVFLHSVAQKVAIKDFEPAMVAGHSLGEFSALVAAEVISFKEGLKLVSLRAKAMQKACGIEPSTMAAVLGGEQAVIEKICAETSPVVVPANYNSPAQVVISGSVEGVKIASDKLIELGVKRVVPLAVSGGFHSPFMQPAAQDLADAIEQTTFNKPICPVYQNVPAKAVTDPAEIKANLLKQLTAPVKWTQSVLQMIEDGATSFTEVGPGKVLQGLIKKTDRKATVMAAQ